MEWYILDYKYKVWLQLENDLAGAGTQASALAFGGYKSWTTAGSCSN
jgi:hypothetical protein